MTTINFILLLLCITASSTAHDVVAQQQQRLLTQKIGPDGTCHNFITTKAITGGVNGKGIVFAIQSHDDDDAGLKITSLGFHVGLSDLENNGTIDYEVYALSISGYYADPERDASSSILDDPTSYDYRGKTESWIKISEGNITSGDLTQSPTTTDVIEDDLFQIPLDEFAKTIVPPNGGIRSFYIATKSTSFIYVVPEVETKVNDELPLVGEADPGDYAPKILVGEGVVEYPWTHTPFFFQPKSFVGKVYYEKECPTEAPSKSSEPSAAPTVTSSGSPSSPPTTTTAPTDAPSIAASEVPSLAPSSPPSPANFKEVQGGLFLGFAMDCTPGQEPAGDTAAMEGAVRAITQEAAEGDDTLSNISVEVKDVICTPGQSSRHLVTNNHRHLPTSSSALDFSMVITGEYRPPSRPGEAVPRGPNLGALAEDSINADPTGFVKDLKERAGDASSLQQVTADDMAVESFEVKEGEENVKYTKTPTARPTQLPTTPSSTQEDDTDAILMICIVVTGGICVLLAAFLLFRHGQRRASKNRREKMERLEEQKERARYERQRRADEASKQRNAGTHAPDPMAGGGPVQYGHPTVAYGHPPPPNYYGAGAPPPQNYNSYSYGGPPPPPGPPPHYGNPNSQGYPYPQQAPPPMQSANQSSVQWKG